MKAKIIVRLFGGLGNQLFIYSSARRLALKNHAELIIDATSGFTNDYRYRRHYQLDHFNIPCRTATAVERLEPFARCRRFFKRSFNARRPFEQRGYIQQEGVNFDSRLLRLRPKGRLYLEGYWQSEGYFKDCEKQIREDLRIVSPINDQSQQIHHFIRKQASVAVHVRFFNEPNTSTSELQSINNATGCYYQRAIEIMEQRIPNAHYFVFSDRPGEAKALLPLDESRMTLVQHNRGDSMAYADLWLMTQCQNFIIANSTFSWWGAWLASHPGKIVVSPGFEKYEGNSFWGFAGLLPSAWIKC